MRCKIAVVGDVMLDSYLWGSCERISPEAPVQVVDVKKETRRLGGACNVMHNLIALDCEVAAFGVIGEDAPGKEIAGRLAALGVDAAGVLREPGRKTTQKSRILAGNQQVIRYDSEDRAALSAAMEERLCECFASKISQFDALILSDYAKGVLSPTLCVRLIALCTEHGIPVYVDPKGEDFGKYRGATLMTPNRSEAARATGIAIEDMDSLKKAGFLLKERCKLKSVVITLSEDGMALFDAEFRQIKTVAKEVFDVTGAGDTVIAAIACFLSRGESLEYAAQMANSAAAVVVSKIGSATASIDEIEEYRHSLNKSKASMKIKNLEQAGAIAKRARERGQCVVFTNGCFDLLHIGHIRYLEEAKSYGDILIVGLNSDTSIRRLKGEGRPVNTEEDRALILGALESVDYVVLFTDDTPYELIKTVEPDILVKGGDYAGKEVVGSDIAKELRLVQFIEGRSSSRIIERIKG